jgi:hypothetical protein
MDAARDLFVQAFWVKCREVIRPEFDRAVERLRHQGCELAVSTQEADVAAVAAAGPGAGSGFAGYDALPPGTGPSLTLAAPESALCFYGDIAHELVHAGPTPGGATAVPPARPLVYALDQLDSGEVAAIVAAWEAELSSS